MRSLLAMLKHETNSFSPITTPITRFQNWTYLEGESVANKLTGNNLGISGFIDVIREHSIEFITPIAAEAMPSGPTDHETFWQLKEKIHSAIHDIDFLLLDLHGAMVTESTLDAEGELLKEIKHNHPALPIALSLDFHANISDTMVEHADIICGYQTYPHIDMKETGKRAAKLMLDQLTGETQPTMSFGRLPILPHTLRQGTDDEPFSSIMKLCREKEQLPDILDISFFGGFPLSDTPFTAPSVIVISNNNPGLAEQIKNEVMAFAWAQRNEFFYQPQDINFVLAEATRKPSPVLLLDHCDNCGSGGTQDVMTVVRAVQKAGLKDVIVASVYDPHAVQVMQVAGIDQMVTLELGGKTNLPSLQKKGEPLTLTGSVKTLTDGRWKIHGNMYQGAEINMGATAVLATENMEIIITSRHIEPWDKGIFIACGINPEQHRFILLKSRIHHRNSFNTIVQSELRLDGEGVTTSDYSSLPFRHLPKDIHSSR